MTDTITPEPIPFLPCVDPNDAPTPGVLSGERAAFAYIGQALTLDEFRAYVATYDFGSIPPDQVVIHNTANPDASWAPISANKDTWWDRNELRLSLAQVKAKRLKQLEGIRDYYIRLGWESGPHLFVDDHWIYLFTPMYVVGTHAKEGNSYRDANGKLHYSLGIEVVGWYGKVGWPGAIQLLLRGMVQALRDALGTFEIIYKSAPAHQPARHQGSVAFHRDYNKPECPGAIITPAYAIPILAAAPPPPPPDPLATHSLPGVDRPRRCGEGFYRLYYGHSADEAVDDERGFNFFGYALTDEAHGVGQDGRACTWMRWERAVAKHVAGKVELALLSEAKAQGWL